MISYKPLFKTLLDKGMKLTDLNKVLPTSVTSKFKKNKHVTTSTLEKLCRFLECRIEDIIEYVNSE
jgi:putative transcriptional regulator